MLIGSTYTGTATNINDKPKDLTAPMQFISSSGKSLGVYLKEVDLSNVQSLHFTSNGVFALHDIAIHISREIGGNANVFISSFNLSQVAARLLLRAIDYGYISQLSLLLNQQKKHAFAQNVKIIESFANVYFDNVHAKVALVWNDHKRYSVLYTGNMSNNKNIERGIIFQNDGVFDYEMKWIYGIINKKK